MDAETRGVRIKLKHLREKEKRRNERIKALRLERIEIRKQIRNLNLRVRPKVSVKNSKKIDLLIESSIEKGNNDYKVLARIVNDHGFRLAGNLWSEISIRKFVLEKK